MSCYRALRGDDIVDLRLSEAAKLRALEAPGITVCSSYSAAGRSTDCCAQRLQGYYYYYH